MICEYEPLRKMGPALIRSSVDTHNQRWRFFMMACMSFFAQLSGVSLGLSSHTPPAINYYDSEFCPYVLPPINVHQTWYYVH